MILNVIVTFVFISIGCVFVCHCWPRSFPVSFAIAIVLITCLQLFEGLFWLKLLVSKSFV